MSVCKREGERGRLRDEAQSEDVLSEFYTVHQLPLWRVGGLVYGWGPLCPYKDRKQRVMSDGEPLAFGQYPLNIHIHTHIQIQIHCVNIHIH